MNFLKQYAWRRFAILLLDVLVALIGVTLYLEHDIESTEDVGMPEEYLKTVHVEKDSSYVVHPLYFYTATEDLMHILTPEQNVPTFGSEEEEPVGPYAPPEEEDAEPIEESDEEILEETVDVVEDDPEAEGLTSMEEEEPEPITIELTRLPGVIVSDYDKEVDYTSLMATCIEEAYSSENPNTVLALGEIYEAQRNLKILYAEPGTEGYTTTHYFHRDNSIELIYRKFYHIPYYDYTEEELYALARLVDGEAGWEFNTDEHQRAVASVVLNRVESPNWGGDNIIEVIHWPGQYAAKNHMSYTERSLANAKYVLENGPTTDGVYQAGFKQGHTVLMSFSYKWDSETTYICK